MREENIARAENLETHEKSTDLSKKRCILVVEDDRSHRALMDKILQSYDFKTEQAENGIIALSKIETGQYFDLIIMDWDMPELNGLDTVKEIRVREVKDGKPHTPVLGFTGHRDPGDREQCLAAGMDAYITKDVFLPRWRQNLVDALQGLIAGDFNLQDFEEETASLEQVRSTKSDIHEFNEKDFEQTAELLKEELGIAIDEYLEDAASYIRDIEKGLEQQDIEKVARGSHPLKSNSRGFGLTEVANLAEAINSNAEHAQGNKNVFQNIQDLLPKLKGAFDFGEKKLKQELKLRSL